MSNAATRPRVPLYLHAGSVYVSAQPAAVSIILGSSVGVSLFDSGANLGGATHYILPRAARTASHQVLAAEGIPVVATETGGARGRRIVFHTDDGSTWVRAI